MAAGGALERYHPGRPGSLPAPPSRMPTPGQPWSHPETVHLIEAYEEKWYSLKRGQLKAQQWEEVATAVAARCGFDEPSKTGTQCRHKIEKLRKRYRAERLRPNPALWPYFSRMDRMERGPLPISVRIPLPPAAGNSDGSEEEEGDEEVEMENERIGSNTRSVSGILREGNWGFSRVPRSPSSRKRRVLEEEEEEEEEEKEEEVEEEQTEGGGQALSELAAVVRRFGEGFVRMENRKMEMMKDLERDWMEMEAKRAEMVLESQRHLLETIQGAFSSVKKAKKCQDL